MESVLLPGRILDFERSVSYVPQNNTKKDEIKSVHGADSAERGVGMDSAEDLEKFRFDRMND